MQNSEFEKNMQQKMEELKLTPSDTVWDRVESVLPGEKKRRRWFIFILLFAVLTTGSLYLWESINAKDISKSQADTTTDETNFTATGIEKGDNNTNVVDSNSIIIKNKMPIKVDSNAPVISALNKKTGTSAFSKINMKKAGAVNLITVSEDNLVDKNKPLIKIKAAVNVRTKPSQPISDSEEIVTTPVNKNVSTTKVNDFVIEDTAVSKTDDLIAAKEKDISDTLAMVKTDSASITKKEVVIKKNKKKWEFGIDMAAGASAVKTGLFSNTAFYSDRVSANLNSSPGTQVTGFNAIPNKPQSGLAFNAGFYAERAIMERWKFKTGLNYLYQSNNIKVGSKVDSMATFNVDRNKSIEASSYFRSGNSYSYKNKFHLLEIPVLLQYQLSKRSPVIIEFGPTVGYLLGSNALVYSNSSSAYFTDKNIFNKLLLSVNAGAGFTIAHQSKWPLTVGYRFKYSIGSVIKTSLSKQHFVNSMLFIKIPVKKNFY